MLGVSNPKTFDWASIPLEECLRGNAMDAFFTLRLFDKFSEEIDKMKSTNLVDNVISPALGIFSKIEYDGMDVDMGELESVGRTLYVKSVDMEDSLYEIKEVHKKINMRSNKDLVGLFYTDETGFTLYPPDNTTTGAPSVSAPTLELLLTMINTELLRRKNGKVEKQG